MKTITRASLKFRPIVTLLGCGSGRSGLLLAATVTGALSWGTCAVSFIAAAALRLIGAGNLMDIRLLSGRLVAALLLLLEF
jgi:hypothetical protein